MSAIGIPFNLESINFGILAFSLPFNTHTGIPCFILLHLIELCRCSIFFFFFLHWGFVATLCWTSLLVPFINSICSLNVSVSHFGNSCNTANFFIIFIFFILLWKIHHPRCHPEHLWFMERGQNITINRTLEDVRAASVWMTLTGSRLSIESNYRCREGGRTGIRSGAWRWDWAAISWQNLNEMSFFLWKSKESGLLR